MWRMIVSTVLLQLVFPSTFGLAPMIGVACNNKLVVRSSMAGKWEQVGGTCCVIAIGVEKDGTLLGIKEDRQLYRKNSPNVGEWTGPLPDSCCVKDVATMNNGDLLGVAWESKLMTRPYHRTTTESGWTDVPRGGNIVRADVHPDGRIFGVTKEGLLKVRTGVGEGISWTGFRTEGLNVKDIAIQPNGLIFGVGKQSNALHVLDSEGKWGQAIPDTDCILSIASVSNLSQV